MQSMPYSEPTRVALVTGGARRVGRAIVERLAEAGFDIAFTYLGSEGDAQELSNDLQAQGRACLTIKADLTDPATSVAIIGDAVAKRFGRLDVLINNASLYLPADLAHAELSSSRRMWAIHVEAPMLLCQRFAPMLRSAKGHVVNMVDLLAEKPMPGYLPYSASKAGLWNLTLGLARELAPDVTVNGIAPGVVEWPENYPQSDKEKYLKRVPLGRAGTGRDVAEAVHFLCTRGSYMTGQILRLDGGRSIT